jgi:hypothetical protein
MARPKLPPEYKTVPLNLTVPPEIVLKIDEQRAKLKPAPSRSKFVTDRLRVCLKEEPEIDSLLAEQEELNKKVREYREREAAKKSLEVYTLESPEVKAKIVEWVAYLKQKSSRRDIYEQGSLPLKWMRDNAEWLAVTFPGVRVEDVMGLEEVQEAINGK